MSTTAVIHASDVQIENVSFSEPKVNKQGGKAVQLKYGGQNLQLRLPKTGFPAGLVQREDPNSGTTYTLIASLKGCDPYAKERSEDPTLGPLYNFMKDLQQKLIEWATENSAKLFGKKRSEESINDSFNERSIMSISCDKVGNEYIPNGKYPPSFRAKVPVWDGKTSMEVVDQTNKNVRV
jgi:hypothetical protein